MKSPANTAAMSLNSPASNTERQNTMSDNLKEREAFESFLLGKYGDVYTPEQVAHYIKYDHVAWLAWQGRAALAQAQSLPSAPEIVQAVARGWCHPKNSHKVMDSDLALAIAAELDALLAASPQPQPVQPSAPVDTRTCTCHPDDNPPKPCARRYALNDCAQDKPEQAAQQWLPIETAPTSAKVLMFSPDFTTPTVGCWGNYRKHNHPNFTHWMPLPAAPQPKD